MHKSIEPADSPVHKRVQKRGILRAYSNDHAVSHNNRQRDSIVPVPLSTLFDSRDINDDHSIVIFNINT